MDTSVEAKFSVLPLPVLTGLILVLGVPAVFTGQWDRMVIGVETLVIALTGLLWTLRQYAAIPWRPVAWLLGVLFVLAIATIHQGALQTRGLTEYIWWFLGIFMLILIASWQSIPGFIRGLGWVIIGLQIPSAIYAIILQLTTHTARTAGLLGNANAIGGYLLFGVWLLVPILWSEWKKTWWAYVCFGILFVPFVFSGSLTAYMASLPSMLIFLVRGPLRHQNRQRIGMVVATLVVLGSAMILPSAIRNNAIALRSKSVEQRIEFTRNAWQMFLAKPLTGWGLGSFQLVLPQFTNQIFEQPLYVHDLYAQLLAETGILVTIIVIGSFVLIGWMGWRVVQHSQTTGLYPWIYGLWLGWLAVAVHAGFDFSWEFPAVQITWWCISGLWIGRYTITNHLTGARIGTRILIAGISVGLLGFGGFIIRDWQASQAANRAFSQSRDSEAIERGFQAQQLLPFRDDVAIEIYARLTRRKNNDLDLARETLDRAIRFNHYDYVLYFLKGRVCLAQGKVVNAQADFQTAYELDKMFHPDIAFEYAQTLYRLGENDQALKVTNQVLRLYATHEYYNRQPITEQLEELEQLRKRILASDEPVQS